MANTPSTLLFIIATVYLATAAVSQVHLSARSEDRALSPVASHQRVTEAWQRGEQAYAPFTRALSLWVEEAVEAQPGQKQSNKVRLDDALGAKCKDNCL